MIDEKKLIEDIIPVLKTLSADDARAVMEAIKNQPKISDCSTCSRRNFYQQGYEDGRREKWIPCSERMPEEEFRSHHRVSDDVLVTNICGARMDGGDDNE